MWVVLGVLAGTLIHQHSRLRFLSKLTHAKATNGIDLLMSVAAHEAMIERLTMEVQTLQVGRHAKSPGQELQLGSAGPAGLRRRVTDNLITGRFEKPGEVCDGSPAVENER
jgi:hypothetical protein